MQFTVPQFIEHEIGIIGPITFKQATFLGIALAFIFVLYFSIGKANLFLFILISSLILGVGLALAFLKIEGRSLPVIIQNFLTFSVSTKMYLWQKKASAPVKLRSVKEKTQEKKVKEVEAPKIAEKSRLNTLSNKIETGK